MVQNIHALIWAIQCKKLTTLEMALKSGWNSLVSAPDIDKCQYMLSKCLLHDEL